MEQWIALRRSSLPRCLAMCCRFSEHGKVNISNPEINNICCCNFIRAVDSLEMQLVASRETNFHGNWIRLASWIKSSHFIGARKWPGWQWVPCALDALRMRQGHRGQSLSWKVATEVYLGFVANSSVKEASWGHSWQKVFSGGASRLWHISRGRGLDIPLGVSSRAYRWIHFTR